MLLEPHQILVWEPQHPSMRHFQLTFKQVSTACKSLNTACRYLLQNKHKTERQNTANVDDHERFNFQKTENAH